MASLDEQKEKVNTLAQKIVDLKKADPIDKDAIGSTVKELLDAKRTYAEQNNGIGVDGQPWEEPMSKSEKKKKEKSAKAAVTVNGKQVSLKLSSRSSFECVFIKHLLCYKKLFEEECDDNHKSIVHPKTKVTLCLRNLFIQNRYLILRARLSVFRTRCYYFIY